MRGRVGCANDGRGGGAILGGAQRYGGLGWVMLEQGEDH